MKRFISGFVTCAALVYAAKKLFLSTPTVYFGGYNRGNLIISVGKREDVALVRLCKAKNPSKYGFGEKIPPEEWSGETGEPIVDLAFLELRDMPMFASNLLEAYSLFLEESTK